jgi:DNA sulfur modification protein DndB
MAIKKTVTTKAQKPVTQKEVVEVVEVTQAVAREIVENQPITYEQEIVELIEVVKEEITTTLIEEAQEPCFTLEAIRGVQATAEYYVVQLPIFRLRELISFVEKNIPAPQRIQRIAKGNDVRSLANYVRANLTDYILPAVTLVIEGNHQFKPYSKNSECGELVFPLGAKLFPLDGQHRILGLQEALKTMEDLGLETIAATIHKRDGLIERRQAFFDLNTSKAVPSGFAKSTNHRSTTTAIAAHIFKQDGSLHQISVFRPGCINYDKASLTKKDTEIFAYAPLLKAIELSRTEIKNTPLPEQIEVIRQYWAIVSKFMLPWQETNPAKIRDLTIATHGIVLEALGKLGRQLIPDAKPLNEKKIEALEKLSFIDWSRGNQDWETIEVLDKKGKVQTSRSGDRIFTYILDKIGLTKSPKDTATIEE